MSGESDDTPLGKKRLRLLLGKVQGEGGKMVVDGRGGAARK